VAEAVLAAFLLPGTFLDRLACSPSIARTKRMECLTISRKIAAFFGLIGYSLRIRAWPGAGSRSASPLRFWLIFEYGGLIP